MSRYIKADPFDKMCVLKVSSNERPVDAVLRMIHEAPTEDVSPVVHGEWIYKNDNPLIATGYWECSICGIGKLLHEENFCPNCGAKMDLS